MTSETFSNTAAASRNGKIEFVRNSNRMVPANSSNANATG
jgi:hypothetical protein